MYSAETNPRTKAHSNLSDVTAKSRSTIPAAAAVRIALILAVSFALLLAPRPAHGQTDTVLYSFPGGSDGANPDSRLTFDSSGNLYGTTFQGGAFGYGTVYELSPNGSGGWKETVLYSFCSEGGKSCTDGKYPSGYVMFDHAGNLYGTASEGGANESGVVFELSPAGKSWTETVLHSFSSEVEGGNPSSGVIMDKADNLYGTTAYGPDSDDDSAVFELSPSNGGWTEQTIYVTGFGSSGARLTMNASGDIFGVAGGFEGAAVTVFELSPNGNGGWNGTVIYTFPGTGSYSSPAGTLALDSSGNLYGSILHRSGLVYKLSLGKNGKWTEKTLNSKVGVGGVVLDAAGNIYGDNGESLYEFLADDNYQQEYLGPAGGGGSDLILDSAGNLYGTAYYGDSDADGDLFEVTPPSVWTTTTLTSSPNPSGYGQRVTFTATVTSSDGPPPDGEQVSFYQNNRIVGTGLLKGGSASFEISTLLVGTGTNGAITAEYVGDPKFGNSVSNGVKQVVVKATSSTTVASSPNPSSVGQTVTFEAYVSGEYGNGAPLDGKVSFYDGSTLLGTAGIDQNGTNEAHFKISTLAAGPHKITATFEGTANYDSSSASMTQTVN